MRILASDPKSHDKNEFVKMFIEYYKMKISKFVFEAKNTFGELNGVDFSIFKGVKNLELVGCDHIGKAL